MLLTVDGQVYGLGSNRDGKLGVGYEILSASQPVLIDNLQSKLVK